MKMIIMKNEVIAKPLTAEQIWSFNMWDVYMGLRPRQTFDSWTLLNLNDQICSTVKGLTMTETQI